MLTTVATSRFQNMPIITDYGLVCNSLGEAEITIFLQYLV